MRKFFPAACWALAMVTVAIGARLGWVDHQAAATLLMIMPMLAIVSMQRGGCLRRQEA